MEIAGLVLILYLAAMMIIGHSSKVIGLEQFHLAGRSLGGLLLTGTFCATIIGASATLGMAGLGYSKGLPGAWWLLSGTLGLFALQLLLADRIRRSRCYTLPELVGTFYGSDARTLAALLILISWIGVIAAQIVASGKVLGVLFGDEKIFMILSTAVFVLYTAHGGQRSVVRTDLIQFGVILCGLILLLKETLGKTGMEVLTEQSFPTSSAMDGQAVFSMILIVGSAYLVGPDIYSRLFSAKDGETARISALRAALILVPLAFAITILGVCARVLLPGIVPEQALPKLMITLLSPSAQGLVAAALLAAFMSSADTSLLTASSILTLDLYRTRLPEASEERLMLASRMFALVLGGLALALALSTPEIIGTLMKAYTIFTSGLLVPVLAGFYREKLNLTSTGALAALAGGGGTAVLLGQKYPLLGLGVSAVLLFAVSWLEIQVQSRRRIRG